MKIIKIQYMNERTPVATKNWQSDPTFKLIE